MNTPARTTPMPARRLSAVAVAVAVPFVLCAFLSVAGCASDPTRLPPGASRADVLQRLGAPTSTYPLAGGERLQYSRAPAGTEVSNIDVDANGRVTSNRQELDEALFDRTIQTGIWRQADVMRTYGRPYEITRVASYDGVVWTWRYRIMNDTRLLHIYIDPAGLVTRYHTGPDLTREWLRW